MGEWLFIWIWLGFGFLGWGLTVGTLQEKFPWFRITPHATIAALLGPVGLFASLVSSFWCDYKIVFRLKPSTKEERWEAFKLSGHESLGREFFERNT